MKREKFWCWWLSRYVYRINDNKFEDVAGARFTFTDEEVKMLKEKKI